MAKYRKKPVVIEAVQFNGYPWQKELYDLIGSSEYPVKSFDIHLRIETLEGTHRADIGDWIIKGVKGELYPCKPDIFEMTYEKV